MFVRTKNNLPWLIFLGWSLAMAAEPTLDAKLVDAEGEPALLSRHLGRPSVLFYEDRDSTEQNQLVKDELFKRGRERNLLNDVNVVAVANLEGYGWFPARGFALAAVRASQTKFGIPILVDWEGALRRPPWGLPKGASTVMVLGRNGDIRFRASGALGEADRARLFDAVEAALAEH